VNGERRERGLKLRVGVFVLVALAAFLGLIWALGARARLFEPRVTIHADFTEVGGLAEGATVRLAGVQIGRVTGVHLPGQPGGKVRVDLTIARQFGDRVRADSIARIDTQGLLGDKIVEITVGTVKAPPVQAGQVLAAHDPTDVGQVITQGAHTVKSVTALTQSLNETARQLNESKLIGDAAALVGSARRVTDQVARLADRVEKGPGLAHALLYDEPVQLARLNDLIAATRTVLDRVERGEGAVGVLTSAQSTAAARRLVSAMDRFGAQLDQPASEQGLLPGLLFDPKYRGVLDEVAVVAKNFREVSDRLAGGRGTLGGLLKDEAGRGIGQTTRDLQAAMANLRAITERVNEGEGTVGALLADPTVYERLVSILDGAQRSTLLRFLLRGLSTKDKAGEAAP
jgi:phospholipid/cholesterol/gamma-HCH transport system substrate-binding protein